MRRRRGERSHHFGSGSPWSHVLLRPVPHRRKQPSLAWTREAAQGGEPRPPLGFPGPGRPGHEPEQDRRPEPVSCIRRHGLDAQEADELDHAAPGGTVERKRGRLHGRQGSAVAGFLIIWKNDAPARGPPGSLRLRPPDASMAAMAAMADHPIPDRDRRLPEPMTEEDFEDFPDRGDRAPVRGPPLPGPVEGRSQIMVKGRSHLTDLARYPAPIPRGPNPRMRP